MRDLTRHEIALWIWMCGGAEHLKKVLKRTPTPPGWNCIKHPQVTWGQGESLLNMCGSDRDSILQGEKKLSDVISTNLLLQMVEQLRFYQEVFDLSVEIEDIIIPEQGDGYNWILLVPKGITHDIVWKKCKTMFKTELRDLDENNMDEELTYYNQRDPNRDGTYLIRLRDGVEPERDLWHYMTWKINEEKIPVVTFLEGLLLHLWYHWKSGEHLDTKNWTFCSGTMTHSCGNAMRVTFRGRGNKLRTESHQDGYQKKDYRPRRVTTSIPVPDRPKMG